MSGTRLIDRQKGALGELIRLVQERAAAAKSADDAYLQGQKSAAADYEQRSAQISARFQEGDATIERELRATRTALTAAWEAGSHAIEHACQVGIQTAVEEINQAERRSHKAMEEARWLARTVFDATRKRLAQQFAEKQQQLRGHMSVVRAIENEAVAWLERYGQRGVVEENVVELSETEVDGDPAACLTTSLEAAHNGLQWLHALRLPSFVHSAQLTWIFVGLAAVIGPAVGWLSGWRVLAWVPITLLLTASIGVAISIWLRRVARRHTVAVYRPLLEVLRLAEAACRDCLSQAIAFHKRKREEGRQQRDADVARATAQQAPVLAACRKRRDVDLPKFTADADVRLVAMQRKYDEDIRLAEDLAAGRRNEVRQAFERELADAQADKERALAENQSRYDQARDALRRVWQAGYAAVRDELTVIRQTVEACSPPWSAVVASDWEPPRRVPPAIRFGQLAVNLCAQAGSAGTSPSDGDPQELSFTLPALLDFPGGSSIYIKTHGPGRQRAIELMQLAMLRLLTSVPPGKMRFTIVDPVGLGQNFATFMHLADHDEALVGHRIWTEPAHIEQRLADLTEHIETVIQKYLRNEFPTIEAYNEEAGEVAEAFRMLVVANYPAGFTESAARRLLSIAASGPRCGVHVLVSVDTKLPPLPGISLADLQQHAAVFSASGEGLIWHDPDFKDFPLVLDEPPGDQAKRVLGAVGAAAVSSKRVEVPFEAIAPAPDHYWKADSRRGIDIPLGRAGATRLQHLRLGHGTSQHVLIAGKTGSGKSTLLHALITNAALRYSPDELELYLIDFKKGVEFKTYVAHALPHARVLAIESEREFGLSVMQRLDAEMRQRGERFRARGVQDIAGFRDAGESLPRILFIVDEFQEFFVEDDKVAQEAALLLDRLVRQGRAFGIHVHLGSQTLGGAYSLARTTLGQMAVRIALECSEADAHLILSEDNAAARLLSRPGEAIYNDANGLIEGNHPFQVVWLPDDRRDVFLDEVSRLAAERPTAVRRPQIVFEGTRPADVEKNETLAALLASAPAGAPPAAPRIWLGEPLAIQEATSVAFARRGAANLLLLGQNDETAAGMLIAAIISLATQFPAAESNGQPAAPQFVFLNGGPVDREYTSLFHKLPTYLSSQVRLAGVSETAAVMAEFAADVAARQASGVEAAPRFLLVFDLARLRELRSREDDFSFSRSADATRRPDQQIIDILRDGPALGVHTILWCDSLTNFQRMLQRQTLKEFETRVLLQMSVNDSSLLIDSQAASTLGRHRALLHREDEGRLEKFRPFSPPSVHWLAWACRQVSARSPLAYAPDVTPAGE